MSIHHSLNHLFPGKSELLESGVFKRKQAGRKRQDEQEPPRALIRSRQDLLLYRFFDATGTIWEQDTFFYITKDDRVFWGFTTRPRARLAAMKAALKRIPDDRIYPKVPENTQLSIFAPGGDALVASNPKMFHVKRPKLIYYYDFRDLPMRRQELVTETFIMKALAQLPRHPNIIRYHGCRVNRGYITGIVLERLEYDLRDFAKEPGFHTLDKKSFIAKLRSAVDYLHSLGLAHNDIKPDNIMVRETPGAQPEPVLIDFGSCAPFGCEPYSQGTPGWCEGEFSTSEKKHDLYSLAKVGEWLETAGSPDEA
jgi:serine/threonine protein kinase